MPNHVTNIIRLTGEPDDIARLLKQIAYDDSSEQDIPSGVHSIDFNKIIPQPKDIGDRFMRNHSSMATARCSMPHRRKWRI